MINVSAGVRQALEQAGFEPSGEEFRRGEVRMGVLEEQQVGLFRLWAGQGERLGEGSLELNWYLINLLNSLEMGIQVSMTEEDGLRFEVLLGDCGVEAVCYEVARLL
jgi:hypothetical protein